MPSYPKAQLSFEDRIVAEHPQAVELAWARIFTTGSQTFFDNHDKKPKYADDLIRAGIYLAGQQAHRDGWDLDLTAEEKKVCRKIIKQRSESAS